MDLLAVQGTLKSLLQHHIRKYPFFHSQWEFAASCRKLSPVLCDNLEGWGGVGRKVGEGFRREERGGFKR